MTEDQDGSPTRRPIDGPTVMGPSAGSLHGPAPEEPTLPAAEETTLPEPAASGPLPAPPAAPPRSWQDGPTAATPLNEPTEPSTTPPAPATSSPAWPDGPTVATPLNQPTWADSPTAAIPSNEPADPDGPTTAVVDESPTTTGPTVGSWPFDELLPAPPTDLVWRPDVPDPPPPPRRPGYYVALGASVVLVVALIAAAALATVTRPTREVAGTAKPTQALPEITAPSTEAPPTSSAPAKDPLAEVAAHPLSSSTARMADATCALPRFDLPDDRQAAFYTAAKTCADDAWRGVLAEAGLDGRVEVVTVTSPVRAGSCGEITPDSPSTQCDGTVYMTPARLRDTEQNGRYPGRYLGVFLREYARALQFTTGLSELAAEVDGAETRLAQQATCLAGVASGAMANRGAVDANITGEISDRLSGVDAPPDAKALLDKGFEERTLAACNTWT